MKNYNLIEWLWKTDSHEKQTPQRFGRYAAMLIMLLTLGVGQMNAYYFYLYTGDFTVWEGDYATFRVGESGNATGDQLTYVADHWYRCTTTKTGSQYIKRCSSGDGSTYWNNQFNASISSTNYVVRVTDGWNNTGSVYSQCPMYIAGDNWASGAKLADWSTTDSKGKMTYDGNVTFTKTFSSITAGTYQFKVVYYNTWTNAIGYSDGNISCINGTVTGNGGNIQFTSYITGDVTIAYNASTGKITITCPKIPITLSRNNGASDGSATVDVGASSLSSITHVSRTGYNLTGYWTATSGGYKVINSNGSFVTYSSNVSTYLNNATPATWKKTSATTLNAQWTAKNYTITLKGNGGSDGAVTTTYNSSSTSSFSPVSRASYSCDGYYTAKSSGSLVLNADGTIPSSTVSNYLSSGKWVGDTVTMLWAHWTYDPTLYDVTFGVGTSYTSLGSLSATASGDGISSGDDLAAGTGITFTASPNTGYEVAGFYSDASCTSSLQSGNTTTYTIASLSDDVTVYVKFQPITYTLTWSPSSAPTGCTYTTKPTTGTYGNTVTMVITPSTGYTVSVSAVDASSNTVTLTKSTNTYTFTQPASAVTVTVSTSQIMSTLSTSISYDGANPSYANPTKSVSSIGIATTATVTATAAGTGYTFAGWTLTNCTRTDGGGATANPITVRSNGDGAAATVVANYTEDLTSTWYVEGDASGPFLGWKADATTMLQKKTGYSTGNDVYWTATVTAGQASPSGTQWEFKIYNSAGADETAKWYGWGTDDDYYWLTNENNSLTLSNSTNNVRFKPYLAGDYEFHFNTSTKVLTVTWPVYNQVRISAASPTDATNTNNFDLSAPVSNVRSVTRSLKANTTYTFKVVYDSEWYGYTSGSFTRSTSTSSNSLTTSTSSGNMTLTTDYAGDYTFRFNQSTKALSIDFPEAYKVTYSKGAVDGSSGNNCSAKDIDNGNASVTSNSTWVKKDHRVVMTAPNEDSGYTFDGWFDNNSSTGDAITTAKNCTITVASEETYYACYHEHKTAITINTDGHGTITTPSPNNSPYNLGVATSQAINATASTGYHWNTWTTSGNAALGTTATMASNTAKGNGTEGGTGTVTATFSPNTYSVQFNGNGSDGGSMSKQTGIAYDSETTLTANAFTRTGYTFLGWATNEERADAGTVDRADEAEHDNLTSTNSATVNLWAVWDANDYTVTLDVDEENHGDIASATTYQDVTYDGATTTVPNRPTAANGYALMGYFTDQNGGGLQVIDGSGNWIASVTGYTDESKNWVHDDDVTLYAYYKKAEITNLELSSPAVAGGADISVTPTISPTPTGTTIICWEVQYNNGTALSSQPEMTTVGSTITFQAPSEAAIYRIECKLYTGTSCGGGTLLDTRSTTFQVASEHEVTVVYKDTLGNTLKAATTVTAQPLDWSDEITAPAVPGYTFHHWILDEGLELNTGGGKTAGDKTTQGSNPIKIKATYAGTLTAVYYKKDVIYFNNTVGWDHVYVYFYSSDKYWSDDNGTGAQYDKDAKGDGTKAHWWHFWGEMTQIEGTNVWYFDYQAAAATINPEHASEINSYTNVAFTKDAQGYTDESHKGYEFFYATKAARRGDFKHSLPMFVPLTTKEYTKNETDYYNHGYWMNYPENTGYTLKFYSTSGADKVSGASDSIVFPFSADNAMPLKLDVEFNTSGNRYFMIKRNDGNHYGKNYTIKQGYSDEQAITVVNNKLTVVPSAKGIYTFTLTYHDDNFYIDVDYPIASNDYRIYYTDNAAWSGAAHTSGWYHPSDLINKIDGEATAPKTDIVSMYIAKGVGITPSMKFQKASVTNEGEITWSDVASGTIDLSSFSSDITKAGVYNIYVSQPVGGGSITVDSIKPYTGNYYIRTDCAGSTKWDSYKTLDHQMTYSDYTADNWGYTHYYCHWVTGGTNVKFTIANDYSVSVSDSLIADYGTVIANIDGSGFLASGSSNNANIRFMWNQATNKLSRAYIAGSGSITDRFLVLEGDAKMYDANGNALTGTHQDHDKWGNYLGTNNQVIMLDDENFVYERTIKVNTTARARLSAKYNNNTQYFIGSDGAFGDGTTVELLGGSAAGQHNMRIVYDFKTNRLVRAYVPSANISADIAINADLMLVREHQNAGEQITFTGSGALSDVHTVYGVMRFNRWTLNNKSTADGHAPLGDPKSAYERGLYWISFPFDVNLSDVFGFGTYGVDWIIEYYDGAGRAQKGYWIDSPSFWKYVMPSERSTFTLKAGKGYVLALDLDLMKSDNEDFWTNNIEQVELFFPSATNVGGIETTTAHTTVDEHECKIDRTNNNGADINKNRTKADSHWNIIGIPSYANYGSTLTSDGETVVNWNSSPYTNDLPFLYEWNTVDNTYTVQSGTTYPFKSMHAYMVQYNGDLYWSLASATPSSPIVARRTYAEKPQSTEFRLELQQNDKKVDQTFVKLSNDENVSANFVFDEDLCKEYNANKANIYTIIENYLPAAGNTLPMSEQTTVVPVGVKIATNGDYTFSMPDGTEGIGITLIDTETGIRTSLSALDYTINLSAGTYNDRFYLEISPIRPISTGVEEVTGDGLQVTGARKVMIDGLLYIVKDGKMFDAQGRQVK